SPAISRITRVSSRSATSVLPTGLGSPLNVSRSRVGETRTLGEPGHSFERELEMPRLEPFAPARELGERAVVRMRELGKRLPGGELAGLSHHQEAPCSELVGSGLEPRGDEVADMLRSRVRVGEQLARRVGAERALERETPPPCLVRVPAEVVEHGAQGPVVDMTRDRTRERRGGDRQPMRFAQLLLD